MSLSIFVSAHSLPYSPCSFCCRRRHVTHEYVSSITGLGGVVIVRNCVGGAVLRYHCDVVRFLLREWLSEDSVLVTLRTSFGGVWALVMFEFVQWFGCGLVFAVCGGERVWVRSMFCVAVWYVLG